MYSIHDAANEESWFLHKGIFTMVEFVAVPKTLVMDHYLSLRESVGVVDTFNRKQLDIICMGVQNSTIFTIINNPRISIVTIFTFLSILKELNLLIKVASNPFAGRFDRFDKVAEAYAHDNQKEFEKPANIIFINLLMLHTEGLLDKALKSIVEIDSYYESINEAEKIAEKLK